MQPKAADDPFRTRRCEDFRRRVQSAPESVYRHRMRGWEYLPVHPVGDEPNVLNSLGLAPSDCRMADAWWGIDGDATLLQSMVVSVADRPAGLYAIATPREERWVYLVAVFDAPFVTRVMFEKAMTRFADAGFPHDPRFRLNAGEPLLRVTDS